MSKYTQELKSSYSVLSKEELIDILATVPVIFINAKIDEMEKKAFNDFMLEDEKAYETQIKLRKAMGRSNSKDIENLLLAAKKGGKTIKKFKKKHDELIKIQRLFDKMLYEYDD